MKKIQSILNIIKLMRPQSVMLMLLFIYIPIFMRTREYIYVLSQVIPMYFLLTGEIILNDYVDVEKDKINKQHRPLAAGKVCMYVAKRMIIIMFIGAIIFGIMFYKKNILSLLLFLLIFIVLTGYSLYIKQIAVIKTFVTAFVTLLCICFINTIIDYGIDIYVLSVISFFYIY